MNLDAYFITKEDLLSIGFSSIHTYETALKSFEQLVNVAQSFHLRNSNWEKSKDSELRKAIDALKSILSSTELNPHDFKQSAERIISQSGDVNSLFSKWLEAEPANSFSAQKLKLIDNELEKVNNPKMDSNVQLSTGLIVDLLESLDNVVEGLKESNVDYQKLNDLAHKKGSDYVFIGDLYVSYQMCTGETTKYITRIGGKNDDWDEGITGDFIKLVHLCFKKQGRVLTPDTTKKYIRDALKNFDE